MSLTDREFWKNYWEKKEDVIRKISTENAFSKVFQEVINKSKPTSALELGGFPGYISIALKKNHRVQKTALLDYYIHAGIVRELLNFNNMKSSEVELIECDLFEEYNDDKFELVHSHGLIEHFEDTKGIIEEHLKYLAVGGILLMTLPNFRGINGWFQKTFDKSNYDKHFIGSMDIEHLKKACEELGLNEISVSYYGRFTIWLENMHEKGVFFRLWFKITWLIFKLFNVLVPLRNRTLSPYILVIAKK